MARGFNAWQCVHCGEVRAEHDILFGTVPPERIAQWRPECVYCRAPPLVDHFAGVRLPSRQRTPGSASPRLGTPAVAGAGSTTGSLGATSPRLSPLRPPGTAPASPTGGLGSTLASTLPSRPATAATATAFAPHVRRQDDHLLRRDLCSRTLRSGGRAVRLRELGPEGGRPKQHAFGPFGHKLPPSPTLADAGGAHTARAFGARPGSSSAAPLVPKQPTSPRAYPPPGLNISGGPRSHAPQHAHRRIRAKPAPPTRASEFTPKLDRAMMLKLLRETNMTRTELYRLFNRFKALCQLSGTPGSINKQNFRNGVSSLAFEDDTFVDRVFSLLDEECVGRRAPHQRRRACTRRRGRCPPCHR